MNVSQGGGYGSDSSGMNRKPDSDGGNQPKVMNTSAGGVEDLKNWLKYESNKKYEESLLKLGLDTSKI